MSLDPVVAARYRARASHGRWRPEERILRHVSKAMRVPASSIVAKKGGGRGEADIATARHVWIYMLVTTLPVAGRRPNDGNIKPVARMIGVGPATVRNSLRRVEDLRDDPAFDARMVRLEAAIAAE